MVVASDVEQPLQANAAHSSNERQAAPASADERIVVPDALRGFALLGILLANIIGWSAWGGRWTSKRGSHLPVVLGLSGLSS